MARATGAANRVKADNPSSLRGRAKPARARLPGYSAATAGVSSIGVGR